MSGRNSETLPRLIRIQDEGVSGSGYLNTAKLLFHCVWFLEKHIV